MSDKRREPRQSVSWPVRVAGISGCGDGELINASMCGVLFSSTTVLENKELALVRITLDPSTSVDCVAQIVRVEQSGEKMLYGADFRYMSPSDRQRLSFALMVLRSS